MRTKQSEKSKFVYFVLIVPLAAFIFCGCGGRESLYGKWELIGIKGEQTLLKDDVEELLGEAYFDFKEDGSVYTSLGGAGMTGAWSADGNKLKVTEGNAEFSGSFTNKRITLESSGVEYIFERPDEEEDGD